MTDYLCHDCEREGEEEICAYCGSRDLEVVPRGPESDDGDPVSLHFE